MTLSSIHNHTVYCDGEDTVEAFCRAAWERGFASLGFSAHAPIPRKTGLVSDWHLPEEKFDEYCETVREARRRWEGRLEVYLGLEADHIPGLLTPGDWDCEKYGLDFIIGSVHYVTSPQGEYMTVDEPAEEFQRNFRNLFHNDGEALLEAYWSSVEGMILSGGYDALGHLDLVKKNNAGNRWFSPEDAGYTRWVRTIARLLAQTEIVTEVNTGGLARKGTDETYPSLEILKILKEYEVPLTINSDAHAARHLGAYYETARETMLRAGYSRAYLFEGRRQGVPAWREEPLQG